MAQIFPSYLRTHRRKWALNQRELAELLGLTAGVVSRYETLSCLPSLEAILGLEIVYGKAPRELLPALARAVRRTVRRNTALFKNGLADKTDAKSDRKRRLLDDILTRLNESHEEAS